MGRDLCTHNAYAHVDMATYPPPPAPTTQHHVAVYVLGSPAYQTRTGFHLEDDNDKAFGGTSKIPFVTSCKLCNVFQGNRFVQI